MSRPDMRWILAFDASCRRCQVISEAVTRATGGKLEVLPLTHPDVVRWRSLGLERGVAWAPTLIKAGSTDEDVQVWTGTGMAAPLVRRLGVRSTFAVLTELGWLRHRLDDPPVARPRHRGLRWNGLQRLGAGAAVAIGLLVPGRTAAFRVSKEDHDARTWVAANLDRLPHTYDDFVVHPLPYRRAIYDQLPDDVRQQLWFEQMRRYRASHLDLVAAQVAVLDAASAFLARGLQATVADTRSRKLLTLASVGAFGIEGAQALFATLGPAATRTEATTQAIECDCYTPDGDVSIICGLSGYCDTTTNHGCATRPSGCGWFWAAPCDGRCR